MGWMVLTMMTLSVSLWSYSFLYGSRARVLGVNTESTGQTLTAYAAIPDTTAELETSTVTKDARPVIVENYFKRWNSPMTGWGKFIVDKSEQLGKQYEVDPTYLAYLTVAIAQQEGNLGKKIPSNCYNTWGYGIHSGGTLCFSGWEEGINRFMTGVAKDYMAGRKLLTPEQIMTRYTPNSPEGSWAKGVNQFLADLYSGRM